MKKSPIAGMIHCLLKRCAAQAGVTLPELLSATAIVGVVGIVAIPAVRSYHGKCCVVAAVTEITGMIREAKENALSDEKYYAIAFDPAAGRVSLLSGRGPDGDWNTADDEVVRSFRLADRGGGLRFGYGSHGPIKGSATTTDGITFANNNTIICNPDLTGNQGSLYIMSASGAAMALSMNRTDFSYKLYRWNGTNWERL